MTNQTDHQGVTIDESLAKVQELIDRYDAMTPEEQRIVEDLYQRANALAQPAPPVAGVEVRFLNYALELVEEKHHWTHGLPEQKAYWQGEIDAINAAIALAQTGEGSE